MPHGVTRSSVSLWIGRVNEGATANGVEIDWGAGRRAVADAWQHESPSTGRYELAWQRIVVDGLQPGHRYTWRLHMEGVERATANATTLPDRLPTDLEPRPFTVLIGSCFAYREDASGRLGRTYSLLPAAAHPHVKFLSGDQVYLDVPPLHFSLNVHDDDGLLAHHLETYAETWSQGGDVEGFAALLRAGANFFTADDHELWNNAPQAGALIRDTWSAAGRARWTAIATRLFRAFQAEAPTASFAVPPLSFLVLDTRLDRTADRARLMSPQARLQLDTWLRTLTGPGVLVVGQPLFWPRAGRLGFLFDYGLADFEEYADLVRLLAASRHSIVVLTGDVHFGRIARCALAGGGELIEVIASPMALVHKGAAGGFEDAPAHFPAAALPGIAGARIETHAYEMNGNHFVTAAFTARGSGVRMRLNAWPVEHSGRLPAPQPIYERYLH